MKVLRLIAKLPYLIGFLVYFHYQLAVANLQLAFEVITPRHRMRPAIVKVPTDASTDMELTLLANLISLTPGTLTLEVDAEAGFLYVHGIQVPSVERFRADIHRLESKLLRVMR